MHQVLTGRTLVLWWCKNGDCIRHEEIRDVDRKRTRRNRRHAKARVRRSIMLARRVANRLRLRRPFFSVNWRGVSIAHGAGTAGVALHVLAGRHTDDGSACLYCDPDRLCRLHED
jgi:hypothetical protein